MIRLNRGELYGTELCCEKEHIAGVYVLEGDFILPYSAVDYPYM